VTMLGIRDPGHNMWESPKGEMLKLIENRCKVMALGYIEGEPKEKEAILQALDSWHMVIPVHEVSTTRHG
jgi:hypothetical protein